MDWVAVGNRIRKQRETLGLTREQLAERIEVTPKFCADIELGVKGMSVPTLCKLSKTLFLKTDYILFGDNQTSLSNDIEYLLQQCSKSEYTHAEELLRVFLSAMRDKE